jgi:transposase-like protein
MTRRHWTPEEKIRIVFEPLNTNIGTAELCRKYALTPTLFNYWRTRFIEGGKQALSASRRNGGGEAQQAENQRLKQLIGELTIANDAFKKIWKERKEDGS